MFRLLIVLVVLLGPLTAQAKLKVFACEPEWAALTQELAGDRADVFTATTAQQDPHHIQARPSLIAQLRRADLVVCTGAGLEAGWLPMLQRRANNPRVLEGAVGYFEAASQVGLLDRPQRLDRSEGDIHGAGNPHVHLDPGRLARIAEALTARLSEIDAAHAEDYRARGATFQARWAEAVKGWEKLAEPLRGMPVVVHHQDWRYLQEWLGLDQVAALEPKPGVPPSSRHLAEVLALAEARDAAVVLHTAYQDPRAAQWLAARTKAKAVELPYTVGGSAQAQDLFTLYEDTLRRLLEATL